MPGRGPLLFAEGFFDPSARLRYTQSRLPHWHQDDTWIFVTFRVADSLPQSVWLRLSLESEASKRLPTKESEEHLNLIEDFLDQGHGHCPLRDPRARKAMVDVLRFGHGTQYHLGDFVLMPNHVHALFRPSRTHSLSRTIQAWKGWGTKRINQILARKGSLWQKDYWDRVVRDVEHFQRIREYIQNNPLKAGLSATDYTLGQGDEVDGSLEP